MLFALELDKNLRVWISKFGCFKKDIQEDQEFKIELLEKDKKFEFGSEMISKGLEESLFKQPVKRPTEKDTIKRIQNDFEASRISLDKVA